MLETNPSSAFCPAPHSQRVLRDAATFSVVRCSVVFNSLGPPMDCSSPGFSVHHCLPQVAQTHVYPVSDAIQPSHPLLPPSPLALNVSQPSECESCYTRGWRSRPSPQPPSEVFSGPQASVSLSKHHLSNLLKTKDSRQFRMHGSNISKGIMVTCQIFPKKKNEGIYIFCLEVSVPWC